jgi:hypothetical protein
LNDYLQTACRAAIVVGDVATDGGATFEGNVGADRQVGDGYLRDTFENGFLCGLLCRTEWLPVSVRGASLGKGERCIW